MKIREIKYPQKFKFYIDSNSKASRFAKLSTCKDGSNLQFAKLSPLEIKVFYSIFIEKVLFTTNTSIFLTQNSSVISVPFYKKIHYEQQGIFSIILVLDNTTNTKNMTFKYFTAWK